MPSVILLIEDDQALREEMLDFLVHRKHSVTGCATLAEATTALLTVTPDAILSDVNLPDGDGVTFCMHNAARFPDALWLLMSGNDDLVRLGNQFKTKSGDSHAFAMVEKPVPMRLLERFIAGAAKNAGERAAGAGKGTVIDIATRRSLSA